MTLSRIKNSRLLLFWFLKKCYFWFNRMKKNFLYILYVIMTGQGQPFNVKWSDGPTMQDSKVILSKCF